MENFENFQLMRTNILLGGQMKLDLILSSYNNELKIDDIGLSPLSKNIPYNKKMQRNMFNYLHQENIKTFFNEIKGYFYDYGLDSQLTHNWPVLSKNIKPYNDYEISGSSRAEYEIYNKEFEFLCPVWIEKITDNLEFQLDIYDKTGSNKFASKSIFIDLNSDENISKYLKQYFEYAGLTKGNNDVTNINLSRRTAYLSGLEVSSGNIITKDIFSLVDNLLYRERPLMEFDSMITNIYNLNQCIVKQLFNFNICFNLDDILGGPLANMIKGQQFMYKIQVYIDGKPLEMRDFYSNYSFIPRDINAPIYVINKDGIPVDPETKKTSNVNVLDYGLDYRYIGLIDKNKSNQNIVHWQIDNNYDYIFNLYDGFGGIIEDEKTNTISYRNHRYGITPDVHQSTYSKYMNNDRWANLCSLTSQDYFNISQKYSNILQSNIPNAMVSGWLYGLKYLKDANYNNKFDNVTLKILLGLVNSRRDYLEIKNTKADNVLSYKNITITIFGEKTDKPVILICSDDRNYITFNYINTVLNEYLKYNIDKEGTDDLFFNIISAICNWMGSIQEIPVAVFNKGLYMTRADGPSLSIKEIDYFKKDSSHLNYVMRYDGKIKPNIIPLNHKNNYWYTKIFYNEQNENFDNSFSNTKYQPIYPSIKFFGWEENILDYNTPPSYCNDLIEYKWFNNGININIYPYLYTIIESEINNQSEINSKIKEYLKNLYKTENNQIVDYIFSKYNIIYNLKEYEQSKYIYEIKLNLK